MPKVLLLLGLAAILAMETCPAQGPAADDPPEIRVRLVGGRLCARATLRSPKQSTPVHLLVDLGLGDALHLHERTAALLELEAGDRVEVAFRDHSLKDLPPRVGRLALHEYLTMEFASELEEIPVVGTIGLAAFGRERLRLDYRRGRIQLLPRKILEHAEPPPPPDEPPAEEEAAGEGGPGEEEAPPAAPADPELDVPMDVSRDTYRFEVRISPERTLKAALGTADFDTWIDSVVAWGLDRPGGDLPTATLGPVDLVRYVALRPGDPPQKATGQPDVLLGNNFLSNFVVTLDPKNKVMELLPVREPSFPTEEQACFIALVREDAAGIETFLEEHLEHRLAREAGIALLNWRLADESASAEVLKKAVTLRAKTAPAKRRSRVMLDLVGQTREKLPEVCDIIIEDALELALEASKHDEDAEAVHKVRSEIGGVLLDAGKLDEAHRHLLAAAFGLPRDGMVNLRMGRFYEATEKYERAWSRYLQAAITEDGGPAGIAGLKRLADRQGITTPYDVDEMERALEGRIPAFQPASTYEAKDGKTPSRRVLVELFTGAHCRPCTAADLALDGVWAHFAGDEVVLVEHHLHVPAPEPLVSPAARERAGEIGVRGTPTVLLDGVQPVRAGGSQLKAGESFRAIRDAAEKRLEEPTPWKLAVTGRVAEGKVIASVTIDGPEAPGVLLRLYLCERSVLFPGANKIVMHRYVNRYDMSGGGVLLSPLRGKREVERSVTLSRVRSVLEQHLDDVEMEVGRDFPLRPTKVDPGQVVLVAFLEAASGEVLQAASWEANPRERE